MATTVIPNTPQELVRVYGNREPIGMQLLDLDGAVYNCTDKTIKFRLVRLPSGKAQVNDDTATIDNASSGKVSYTPQADYPVGEYAIYFKDTTSSPTKLWPYDGARYILRVIPETSD